MVVDVLDGQALTYQQKIWADPVGWIYEVLGTELCPYQAEIAEAVRDYPRVAVRSANAVGKTGLAARLVIWYLMGLCPSYAVTTASAWRGVERSLWPEIRRQISLSTIPLGPRPNKTSWELDDQWMAFGVSADQPENFSGFRTPNGVFVVVDEASALKDDIWEAIDGLCNNDASRVLLIGNPLRALGPFYRAFKSPGWKTFHISAFDTPNVITGKLVIPGLADRSWVEAKKAEYGEHSAFYRTRVLGEFPPEGDNSLIIMLWAEKACELAVPDSPAGTLRMGVDVARHGTDRTVYLLRDDRAVRKIETQNSNTLTEVAGRATNLAAKWNVAPQHIYVDDVGLGGGVVDMLLENGIAATPVNNGKAATDVVHFENVRAESYWNMREAFNPESPNHPPLALPDDLPHRDVLIKELCAPQYEFSSKGRIKLESKEDIKARLGVSPDLADALAMTFVATAEFSLFVPGDSTDKKKPQMEDIDEEEINRMAMIDGDAAWQ